MRYKKKIRYIKKNAKNTLQKKIRYTLTNETELYLNQKQADNCFKKIVIREEES